MKSIQRRQSRSWRYRPAGDSVLEFRTLTQYRCIGAQQPKEVPQVRRAEYNTCLLLRFRISFVSSSHISYRSTAEWQSIQAMPYM